MINCFQILKCDTLLSKSKSCGVTFDLQIILGNFSINYIQFVESRVAVTDTAKVGNWVKQFTDYNLSMVWISVTWMQLITFKLRLKLKIINERIQPFYNASSFNK